MLHDTRKVHTLFCQNCVPWHWWVWSGTNGCAACCWVHQINIWKHLYQGITCSIKCLPLRICLFNIEVFYNANSYWQKFTIKFTILNFYYNLLNCSRVLDDLCIIGVRGRRPSDTGKGIPTACCCQQSRQKLSLLLVS